MVSRPSIEAAIAMIARHWVGLSIRPRDSSVNASRAEMGSAQDLQRLIEQYLGCGLVTKEAGRTGAGAISACHEDGDEIANLDGGQRDSLAQPVKRRAEASNNRHRLKRGGAAKAIGECDWVIAADDRAEVSAGGKLVVQAAIDDGKQLSPAPLHINDAG